MIEAWIEDSHLQNASPNSGARRIRVKAEFELIFRAFRAARAYPKFCV
jgi:hypothetical protein